MKNPKGGLTIMEFRGHGEGKGGLKYGSCPWYGMDNIFWNRQFWILCVMVAQKPLCFQTIAATITCPENPK